MTGVLCRIAGRIYKRMAYLGIAATEWTEDWWFIREIDRELRSVSPPLSGLEILFICLMVDLEFMVSVLKRNHGFRGFPIIAAISQDPLHPLYHKVKHAFDFAQRRRFLAGLSPDPWPMTCRMSYLPDRNRRDRRLVWVPIMAEIKEAWKMYHRFVREGFCPFAVDSQGNPLFPASSFDPQAGEILFRSGD